ncbi:MAG: translation initiation factor IF-2 [Verrucomicrobiae bacterium]|nr:translation initiation factor IF-2 [Verrucomicrobiae bacterium]
MVAPPPVSAPAATTDVPARAAAIPSEPAPKAAKVAENRIVTFKTPFTVRDLAAAMNLRPFVLISDLMALKILVTINQPLDFEMTRKVCEKHGFRLERERAPEAPKPVPSAKTAAKPSEQKAEGKTLGGRPPVVTIMGHVDHGKTSLIDAIRKANVVADEHGGITQHIGAYTVSLPPDPKADKNAPPRRITFIDTPGHEAFTAMRVRGANITDIVVLVVAGNEGLMPQTLEALSHARAANVPIIVAITKMDLEVAQRMLDRVKKQLQEKDLTPEDWGGKTITVPVSATKKTGLNDLLEMILLQAEMMELKAVQDGPAEGTVIEAQMEPGRGATATVLVRRGALRTGDALIVGAHWARVKALLDDHGKPIKRAEPSQPAKIIGLSGVPEAGALFRVVASDTVAREHSEAQHAQLRAAKLEGPKRLTLEDLLTNTADNRKLLKVILKADVQGSAEAISQSVVKLPQAKVKVDVIHAAVGPVSESDVLLASASKALIIGFQVKVDPSAAEAAKREGVPIQLFRIIYEITDKLQEIMAGLLDPETKLVSLGQAEVKQVFEVSKGGVVAGCIVSHGRIERRARVRVVRRRNVLFEGGIGSLRRFQDDVNEVRTGLECGIRVENFNDFEPGDTIEAFQIEKIAQKL